MEDSKYTEHSTEDQPEKKINHTTQQKAPVASPTPCKDGYLLYERECISGLSIIIIQSLPNNVPEYQAENQTEDQTEDEINRIIHSTECDISTPCIDGYLLYNCVCTPGLIIRIHMNLKSDLYANF